MTFEGSIRFNASSISDRRVGGMCQGPGEVDGGRRLPVTGNRAGDGDHPFGGVELLEYIAQGPVLVGLKRGGINETDQMSVQAILAPRGLFRLCANLGHRTPHHALLLTRLVPATPETTVASEAPGREEPDKEVI